MSLFQLDGFSDCEGKRFEAAPAGTYPVTIIAADMDKVSGDKAKYPGAIVLTVRAQVDTGEEQEGHLFFARVNTPLQKSMEGTPEEYQGMPDAEKGRRMNEMARLFLAADRMPEDNEIDIMTLTGANLRFVNSPREYQGNLQDDVKDYLPAE